MKRKWLCFADY